MNARVPKVCARALLASLCAWGLALAHAHLIATSPAAGAVLTSPPGELELRFNEPVRVAVLKLEGAGREQPIAVDRSAPPGNSVKVPLPQLAAGSYAVHYSVVTVDDGHVVTGSFSFVLQSPAAPKS